MAADPAEGQEKTIPFPGPQKRRRRLGPRRRQAEKETHSQPDEIRLPQPSMTGWIIAAVLILLVSGAYAAGLIPDWRTLLYGPAEKPQVEEPSFSDGVGVLPEDTLPQAGRGPTEEEPGGSGGNPAEKPGDSASSGVDTVRTVAELYDAMPPAKAGPLLASMDREQAVAVLRQMRREQAAAVLAQMDTDDAAELIRLLMAGAEEGGGQR